LDRNRYLQLCVLDWHAFICQESDAPVVVKLRMQFRSSWPTLETPRHWSQANRFPLALFQRVLLHAEKLLRQTSYTRQQGRGSFFSVGGSRGSELLGESLSSPRQSTK
jgi:hypothetical protein